MKDDPFLSVTLRDMQESGLLELGSLVKCINLYRYIAFQLIYKTYLSRRHSTFNSYHTRHIQQNMHYKKHAI